MSLIEKVFGVFAIGGADDGGSGTDDGGMGGGMGDEDLDYFCPPVGKYDF